MKKQQINKQKLKRNNKRIDTKQKQKGNVLLILR